MNVFFFSSIFIYLFHLQLQWIRAHVNYVRVCVCRVRSKI